MIYCKSKCSENKYICCKSCKLRWKCKAVCGASISLYSNPLKECQSSFKDKKSLYLHLIINDS
jgi:hypothetical protein